MSEIDNSTLVESALEMQPLEQETAATTVTTESVIEPTTSTTSNQEAMTALVLSRLKKQGKQVENITRLIGQVPTQFRNLENRQSRQVNQLARQVKVLQNQVRQVQKQIARIRIRSASAPAKKRATRKAVRRKSRR